MSDFLVGIDAGGTMVKAALFDLGGNQIDVEHRANGMTYPHVGWTERDPDAMWVSAAGAIATLLERNAVDPARVRAVAPSGYGGGVFLIGADGAVVRPGLGSTDSRAITLIDGWKTSGLKARIEQDIQQEVWPGQTLPLLAWFQAHEPEVAGRAAHVPPLPRDHDIQPRRIKYPTVPRGQERSCPIPAPFHREIHLRADRGLDRDAAEIGWSNRRGGA